MDRRLELQVLAALSAGAVPAHVVARRLRVPQSTLYAALRRLDERRLVRRLDRSGFRITRRGLAALAREAALAKLLARSG